MINKSKNTGLVADLMPNIQMMKIFAYPVFNYYDGEFVKMNELFIKNFNPLTSKDGKSLRRRV